MVAQQIIYFADDDFAKGLTVDVVERLEHFERLGEKFAAFDRCGQVTRDMTQETNAVGFVFEVPGIVEHAASIFGVAS